MTLQEYLVKIGFQVDHPSLKKFLGAVSSTAAQTAELGAAAIETAAAIELMVTRVARNYESLYYMSQRTNQSVQFIQKTQFGFKQIGLSAEEADASIENIAHTLRTQPWLKALFGGADTPQKVAGNLAKSGLPYFLQVKFAEMIGMSEKTLFHMQKFSKIEAEAEEDLARRQKAAGLDPGKLAEQSVVYGRELNKLESDLEIFGVKVASNFLGPTGKGITMLDDFVQGLSKVDVATKGWLSTLVGFVGAAGGVLLLERAFKFLLGVKGGGGLADILKGIVSKKGIIPGSVALLAMIKHNDPETKKTIQDALGPILDLLGRKNIDDYDNSHRHQPGWLKSKNTDFLGHQLPRAGRGGTRGNRNNNPGNMEYGAFAIAHGAVGTDGRFAIFPDYATGAAAQAALVRGKSYEGLTLHEFASKYAEGAPAWEKTVGKEMGIGPGDIVNNKDPQLLDAIRRAEGTGPPAGVGGDTTNHVTLHSKTDVHVDGGSSPADAYKRAADDANSTLLRNLQGVMR